MANTHTGVILRHRKIGGVFNVQFNHPRFAGRQVCRSTETADTDIAKRIAEELSRLIHGYPTSDTPPDGLHPRTYALWGRSSAARTAAYTAKLLDNPFFGKTPKGARFVEWDGTSALEKEDVQRLLAEFASVKQERDAWREKAQIAEGMLNKMGKRILRQKSAQRITLGKAKQQWVEKIVGLDPDYMRDLALTLGQFVTHFGEKTLISDMEGREEEITQWLAAIRKPNGDAENLIHKTDKGHMVRSKSELVIANLLFGEGINYEYEQRLAGMTVQGTLHPDFSFADAAGDRIIWEHLGMMDDPEYQRGWEWKRDWYQKNGYTINENLFVTEERKGQGLNMEVLREVAEKIKGRAM